MEWVRSLDVSGGDVEQKSGPVNDEVCQSSGLSMMKRPPDEVSVAGTESDRLLQNLYRSESCSVLGLVVDFCVTSPN